MKNKRLIGIMLTAGVILLIPLIAMLFTNEVNWTLSDFAIGGVLLFGTGLLAEIVLRKVAKKEHRITLLVSLIVVLLLIWVELAVGIFGSPLAGS